MHAGRKGAVLTVARGVATAAACTLCGMLALGLCVGAAIALAGSVYYARKDIQ